MEDQKKEEKKELEVKYFYFIYAKRGSTHRLVKVSDSTKLLDSVLKEVQEWGGEEWCLAEVYEMKEAFGIGFFASSVFLGNGIAIERIEDIVKEKRS